ncbi:MAG: DUF4349 domain-containing protein [Ignavibacteria bacterium]
MKTEIKAKLFFAILFLIFISAGCNNKGENKMLSEERPANYELDSRSDKIAHMEDLSTPVTTSSTVESSFENINFYNETDRMLIRSGSIKIEADNFNSTEEKLLNLIRENYGYVTNSSSQMNVSNNKQGSITVRVPSEKFDSFLNSIGSAGKVISQNISGQDVTSEYIDLEARQRTQKELEFRLLDLLNSKTANLKDVVEVEEKLSSVRQNIESTEGRMKFLKNQSAYSTLSISIFEPALLQTTSGGGFFYEMKEAFKDGLQGLTGVFSFLITFLISAIPLLVILTLIILMVRKFLRTKKVKLQNV